MSRVFLSLTAATLLSAALTAGPIYSVVDLGSLGGSQSTAYRISESGQSAGWSRTSTGISQAVTHSGGSLGSLASPGEAQANGLNSAGLVVGSSNALGRSSAMLWQQGTAVDLGTLGGSDAWAMDVNNAGQIVGGSVTASGAGRAFLYQNGQMKDLGTLAGGVGSTAMAINESGQVAGWSQSAMGSFQAFVYSPGQGMQAIGGSGSYAMDINDSGQVAGHQRTAGGLHAFLYSGGVAQDLGTLGGAFSFGFGLNGSGQVVGYSWMADGTTHAFLYMDGVMLDLNSMLSGEGGGWELLEAYGINDAGQIVGSGRLNGQVRAFRLDPNRPLPAEPDSAGAPLPTPEPSTSLLMAGGLLLLGWRGVRRWM